MAIFLLANILAFSAAAGTTMGKYVTEVDVGSFSLTVTQKTEESGEANIQNPEKALKKEMQLAEAILEASGAQTVTSLVFGRTADYTSEVRDTDGIPVDVQGLGSVMLHCVTQGTESNECAVYVLSDASFRSADISTDVLLEQLGNPSVVIGIPDQK